LKTAKSILAIIMVVVAGCGDGNKQSIVIRSNDDLITVDVTKSYPKKELILQDFMDVEYIPLETTDEFLTQGVVRAVGRNVIVMVNSTSDGDIFIYDRNGKGVRKINRKGQGGEEYINIVGIVLDEDNNEIFVHERKMMVYDLNGTFKRSFKYRYDYMFIRFYNYDRDHLIAYDATVEDEDFKKRSAYHVIISKQDGSIINEVQIPYKKKISAVIKSINEGMIASNGPAISAMIPYRGNWILTQSSADTVYMYLPDNSMLSFIARTPSMQSMNPAVFLFPHVFTEQYYFMSTVKKEPRNDEEGFSTTNLVYDRQDRKFYEYVVYNNDFSTKNMVDMLQQRRIDDDIAFWQKFEAHELVEAHNNGELKGRLKEIAAELDAEDNPVIMLVRQKK
jgi:hypothetical protein